MRKHNNNNNNKIKTQFQIYEESIQQELNQYQDKEEEDQQIMNKNHRGRTKKDNLNQINNKNKKKDYSTNNNNIKKNYLSKKNKYSQKNNNQSYNYNLSQNSQNQQDQIIGQQTNILHYINIRRIKSKTFNNIDQNINAVNLLKRDQLLAYLAQLENEERQKQNNFNNNNNNNKKNKTLSVNQSKKQQIIDKIFFNFQISNNACLIGGMDKSHILNQVVDKLKKMNEYLFVIKGYSPSITQKKIFNSFGSYLMNCKLIQNIGAVHIPDLLKQYKQALQKSPKDTIIYIVVYDLSSSCLLTMDIQDKLCDLLTLPRVRVVTYMQNMKIVLHMSFKTIQQYNFAYINCNGITKPIINQLKFMSIQGQRTLKTQMQIMQIWKSLNCNQRQIAQILAQNQLENIKNNQQNYLTFAQLLQCCIDKIILSDDYQLRQNLIQLTDHKVIIQDMDKVKNKKVYIMKLDKKILESIVDGKYDRYDNNQDI